MGNTTPESDMLKIFIETEKQFYNSGSSIEGVVFIQAMDNFKFDALYIRVEGDEWCQWFQGSSKNRVKYTGSDHFYAMEYLLQRYSDQLLTKGKYAYPFSIELSQNIPGSFESAKYDAKIEYKLVAYFVSYTHPDRRQSFSLPILIRQPFRQEIVAFQGRAITNPSTCGCLTQGQVQLSAHFQRNVCFQGQTVRVDMSVDNSNGTHDIQQLMINLVQYTFISANNGVSRTYKHTIYKHAVGKRILKGDKKQASHNLTIPSVSHQTAISTLVANYYRIEVTASMGTFSSDNPSIYAPLFILKKSFNLKNKVVKQIHPNPSVYKTTKPVLFRAPEYWFRKNRNLSVMNFKIQDMISAAGSQIVNEE